MLACLLSAPAAGNAEAVMVWSFQFQDEESRFLWENCGGSNDNKKRPFFLILRLKRAPVETQTVRDIIRYTVAEYPTT